ncbi:MAG: hypothetical protein FJ347_03985 [Sphingomonadales bacterium]|nr:hypothetical protein [Sphingomonadales bacterium]
MIPEAIKRLITPSDGIFYVLFNTGAVTVVKMTDCLYKIVHEDEPGSDKWTAYLQEMKLFYGESQENYRQTVKRLSKVFITPIDRESVHQLSVDLHNVARSIYIVPRSISWDAEHKPDSFSKHLGLLLKKSAAELQQMVEDIGTPKRRFVMKHAKELIAIKREMEIAYDQALKSLYESKASPSQFLRRLDAYNALREVGDYCCKAAHTAEGIVLTHVG